jgi:Na+-driven multidrug efflux pump
MLAPCAACHVLPASLTRILNPRPAVARVVPVLAWVVVGDGLMAVLGGIVRGAGRQSLGAWLNLLGYWAVGEP